MQFIRSVTAEIKQRGLLRFVDRALNIIYNKIVGRFYDKRSSRFQYRFIESIFLPRHIGLFLRHKETVNILRKKKIFSGKILDAACGTSGIVSYLSDNYHVYGVDLSLKKIKNARTITLCANGMRLPFANNTFDAVVALDLLEHIKDQDRIILIDELKRVSSGPLIMHFPAQSDDGLYQGKEYDQRFMDFFMKIYRKAEINTKEHLANKYPDPHFLKNHYPEAEIYPFQNADLWLKYTKVKNLPFIGFIGGIYYLFLNKEPKPPYWDLFFII